MAYNQTFRPERQGSLSAPFSNPPPVNPDYRSYASDPARRHSSSTASSYGPPPPQHPYYAYAPRAGYPPGPGSDYGERPGSGYAERPGSDGDHRQTAAYGASAPHVQPGRYVEAAGWQRGWEAPHAATSHPLAPAGPVDRYPDRYPDREAERVYGDRAERARGPLSRHSSTSSQRSQRSVYSRSEAGESRKAARGRRRSHPGRHKEPRRPSMADSVLAAWGGLKGAFDKRH